MDFFASQDAARRKTKLLFAYFVLAVLGLIAALYVLIVTIKGYQDHGPKRRHSSFSTQGQVYQAAYSLWDPQILLWSAVGTLSVVFLGSGYKTMQLSAGGSVVARDLGGSLISRDTSDPDERRLLNVVEEMSIASGMPVPEVYLLSEEDTINAFAAGRTPGDAIIGVTRGCMKLLSRDELQGVIAHEFSHILNGDMRLNLRLIGLIHGILVIAIIGRVIMRMAMESSRGGGSKKGSSTAGFFLFGLAVTIIGYAGVLAGKLIKAAISRQREFLADASAVQFTRNPDGIAGALKKLGGAGSKLNTPQAEEASHMMFGSAFAHRWMALFETHPSLQDRIKAIQPSWDGSLPRVSLADISAGRAANEDDLRTELVSNLVGPQALPAPEQTVNSMGQVTEAGLIHAQQIKATLPDHWQTLLRNPAGAQAVMFAMVLSQDDALRDSETSMLRALVDPSTLEVTLRVQPEVHHFPSATLIAVVDLAIPALRRLSPGEYERFADIMHRLMVSDQRIELFEFMLQKVLRRHLDLWFRRAPAPRVEVTQLAQVAGEARIVLSTLASVCSHDPAAVAAAYQEGSRQFEMHGVVIGPAAAGDHFDQLDAALDRLDRATPLIKKQILYACGKTVMADQRISSEEAELLRAVADTIGCPIPPFVSQG